MNTKLFAKNIARFGYNQIKNLAKLSLGHSLTTPSLGSVTLDIDDVIIAKKYLNT